MKETELFRNSNHFVIGIKFCFVNQQQVINEDAVNLIVVLKCFACFAYSKCYTLFEYPHC